MAAAALAAAGDRARRGLRPGPHRALRHRRGHRHGAGERLRRPARGGFLTLLGPSGCGKSTLLRVVADLVPPSERTDRRCSATRREQARRDRDIGFVFQDAGAAAVAHGAARTSSCRSRSAAASAAARDAPTPRGAARAGRARRLRERRCRTSCPAACASASSIARALVSGPRILLMDEPFGALDEITRDRLNEELLRIWQETGTTILFVTHSIHEAAFLGQQVLVLAANPGRVREIVPVDLPRRPHARDPRDPRVRAHRRPAARAAGDLLMAAPDRAEHQRSPATAPRAGRVSRRAPSRWRDRLPPIARRRSAAPGVLWQLVVTVFDVQPFIAPSPSAVAADALRQARVLLRNLLPTAIEALPASCSATWPRSCLATVFVHNKTLEETFFPVVVMVNTIPVVAKAPILVLLLGNGMEPKIAIAALICFFPTLVNMVRGLRGGEPAGAGADARAVGQPARGVLQAAACQNSLPYLFSALKIAASTCGDRRDRRRMDRLDLGHRRADHPGDLQFDSPLLYATDRRRLASSPCAVLRRHLAAPSAASSAGTPASPLSRRTPTPRSRNDRSPMISEPAHDARRRASPTWWWSAAARPASPRRVAARAQRRSRHAARALPLSRRPGLGRHGAGARRHVQRHRRSPCAASASR